ncbi:hypothetical protein Tco_0973487 [Tanacetum coccineum]
MIDCDAEVVNTRGGKTTTQDDHDNNTNVLPKEPLVVELEKPVGPNNVLTNDQPQMTSEPVVQPSNEEKTPPVPFPRRLRKEKEKAQQKKFLENLKQLHINLPFIEAIAQMPNESASSDGNNESDPENSIRRIDSANTPYPVTQRTTNGDDVISEHLYSASANEIDEEIPELKNLPQHLEYAYLHGDKSFPIIISSKLSEEEKISLL